MKLSESVVESFGNQEVDSSVDDLTNKLANKIKILKDLKNEAGNPEVDCTDETVDKVIEETFKDKSIAKSFGDKVAAENDSIIAGWSHPNSNPPIIFIKYLIIFFCEQEISPSPPVSKRGRWRRKTWVPGILETWRTI